MKLVIELESARAKQYRALLLKVGSCIRGMGVTWEGLEMQPLRPHPRACESVSLNFTRSSGDSYAH